MIRNRLHKAGNTGQPHGLKGEINLFADDTKMIAPGEFLFVEIDGTMIPFEIESVRPRSGDSLLVKFHDVDSADGLALLRNTTVYTAAAEAETTDADNDDGHLYASDMEGYTVIDTDSNSSIGIVSGYEDSTLNTLLILERPDGSTLYLPFVEEFIESIDTAEKKLEVSLPQGFLEIN